MSGGRRLSAEVVELALVFDAAGEGLAKQAERDLTSAGRLCVPLQMCLRDVWRPHVLFQENIVTGMVDFGAMDVDCVAGDVARLLGSLTGNDEEGWRIGVAAYEAIRPLSEPERALIPAYDRSGVLLSAANWLRWLLDEDRTFPDESVALERLVELAGRLRAHEL
jgi:Ser/Thr protein kinase RdoA (MazF antagonist)